MGDRGLPARLRAPVLVDKGIETVPWEIAMMIGDVAHHARSALDWLAWSLARSPNTDTSFPIWTKPSINKGTGRRIQPYVAGGTTREVKKLVRRVQPYVSWKGDIADCPLVWMRDLDWIHKHRHLVPAVCSHDGWFRTLPNGIHGTIHVEEFGRELKAGEKVARITFSEPSPGLEFGYHPKPYVSVNGIAPVLDRANIVAELRYGPVLVVRRLIQMFAEHIRR